MEEFFISHAETFSLIGGMLSLLAGFAIASIEGTGGKPRKITFAVISVLAGLFSLVGAHFSSVSSDMKTEQIRELSDSTNTHVYSIKEQLDSAQKVLSVQLRSLDSLDNKLGASTASALRSIETTKEAVTGFYRVSEQLKRAAEEERKKLDLGKPEISTLVPFFFDRDSVQDEYRIKVPIKNLGDRTAYDFELRVFVLIYDKENPVFSTYLPYIKSPSTIPPFKKVGFFEVGFSVTGYKMDKIAKKSYDWYLMIESSCLDLATGNRHTSPIALYNWKENQNIKDSFGVPTGGALTFFQSYISSNNIKFPPSQ